MKSWILVIFPTTDEYKEQQLSLFFAEGAVVLFLSLIGMLLYNNYLDVSVQNALFIPIAIFLAYLVIRHSASGIEFADVATDNAYKKELKVILMRNGAFAAVMLGYFILFRPERWIEGTLVVLAMIVVWFLTSFISLKRSYRKNRDLL